MRACLSLMVSFKTWMHQRPEIPIMKLSTRLRPGRFFTLPDDGKAMQKSDHEDVVMEARVRARNGSVLGKGSILKMYLFPGQKESSALYFRGTAHVFKVDGYPIQHGNPNYREREGSIILFGSKWQNKEAESIDNRP